MNLLDFNKFTFALSVIKLIRSSNLIPFFCPNRFFGFSNSVDFLNNSLNKGTLTLSPDFFSLPFNLASENLRFPSKFILLIFTFLFFSTPISSFILLATIVSNSCLIFTCVLKNPFFLK